MFKNIDAAVLKQLLENVRVKYGILAEVEGNKEPDRHDGGITESEEQQFLAELEHEILLELVNRGDLTFKQDL